MSAVFVTQLAATDMNKLVSSVGIAFGALFAAATVLLWFVEETLGKSGNFFGWIVTIGVSIASLAIAVFFFTAGGGGGVAGGLALLYGMFFSIVAIFLRILGVRTLWVVGGLAAFSFALTAFLSGVDLSQ